MPAEPTEAPKQVPKAPVPAAPAPVTAATAPAAGHVDSPHDDEDLATDDEAFGEALSCMIDLDDDPYSCTALPDVAMKQERFAAAERDAEGMAAPAVCPEPIVAAPTTGLDGGSELALEPPMGRDAKEYAREYARFVRSMKSKTDSPPPAVVEAFHNQTVKKANMFQIWEDKGGDWLQVGYDCGILVKTTDQATTSHMLKTRKELLDKYGDQGTSSYKRKAWLVETSVSGRTESKQQLQPPPRSEIHP